MQNQDEICFLAQASLALLWHCSYSWLLDWLWMLQRAKCTDGQHAHIMIITRLQGLCVNQNPIELGSIYIVYKQNTDAQALKYKTGDDRHKQMEKNQFGYYDRQWSQYSSKFTLIKFHPNKR